MISGVTRNSEAPGQISKSSPPSRFPNLSPVPLFPSPHPPFPSLIFPFPNFHCNGKIISFKFFCSQLGDFAHPVLHPVATPLHMVDRRRLLPGVCWPSCLSPVRRTTSQDRYLQFFVLVASVPKPTQRGASILQNGQ